MTSTNGPNEVLWRRRITAMADQDPPPGRPKVPPAPKLPDVESPDPHDVLDDSPSPDEVVEQAQPSDEIIAEQPSVDELIDRDR
jgi:hypothetical protein